MEGRSTSRINGETVPISLLKEAAGILIDIHGQHEHQSLLYKKKQLEILDAFAGAELEKTAGKVKAAYDAYRKCKEELEQADQDETERVKEAAFLEFEIGEIQKAQLKAGEDEGLEQEYRKMVNSKKIVEDVGEAYRYTSDGSDSASECLSRAIRCLSEASVYDSRAEELYGQLMELDSLLNDFNRDLSDYSKTLEFSGEEFSQTEDRLNEINRLKTKYGNSIEEIQAYCVEKEQRLEVLGDYEHYMASLRENYKSALAILEKDTKELTKQREEQSRFLEQAIRAGLQDLNFPEVQFEIHFKELPEYTRHGRDDVEFMISMNPGEPVKPLGEVASGGELSRIMLAIKAVMADRDDIETLIFDEIDVGISGRTAQKVSEKMAVIGKRHQVICITHLAQIAAMADAHYLIEKNVKDKKTRTEIRLLSQEDSVEELARILGGARITDAVIENAREMKALAKSL